MISICIPTKNAGGQFEKNLRAWRDQQVGEEVELVVADSGSDDATVQTARAFGADVFTVSPTSFNHGETRNLLGERARGDILVFTVQDATPADRYVLEELTRPLRENSSLSGVTGKQIPQPDADFMARWEAEALSRQIEKGRRIKRLKSLEEFLTWDFKRRFECIAFDNVCSAIPRRVCKRFAFAGVEFGEDIEWSLRVLKSGGLILHNPNAQVRHSHNRPPNRRLKRYFIGKRSTNHILRMPAEYSSLTDRDVAQTIDELSAWVNSWVGAFYQSAFKRRFFSSLASQLNTLMPEGVRRALRPLRSFFRRKPVQRLQWSFIRLWGEVVEYNGPVPLSEIHIVARQLEAMLVGDFLGSYYHTCQVENRVSPELKELVRRVVGEE